MNSPDPHTDHAYVDDLFAQLRPVEPSPELKRNVAQIPIEHPRAEVIRWPFGNVWTPSLALVAAAAVGFFFGQSFMNLRAENALEVAHLDGASESGLEAETTGIVTANNEAEVQAVESDLESLLLLATAGDFQATSWDDTFEVANGDEFEEETF